MNARSGADERCGCTLTVCFDDPFWIALVERTGAEGYSVARHVFGPEPTDPQVLDFTMADWRRLQFTCPQVTDYSPNPASVRRVNPKRLQRLAKKEMARDAVHSTKAQQALSAQREESKAQHKAASKARRQQEERERFLKQQAKKKQKARGH
ncbi:MAG: YjdF family protein [Eggerthellaceae bacterium]